MIYTLGYWGAPLPELDQLIDRLKIDLVIDIRLRPYGRRQDCHKTRLAAHWGDRYEYRGKELGGLDHDPDDTAIADLAAETRTVALLCACKEPGDCHRYYAIAVPLLVQYGLDEIHLHRRSPGVWEAITTSELTRAIDEDSEYECEMITL